MSSATMEDFFTRKPEYVPHPPGEWRAVFVSCEADNHKEYGKQAKLTFETEVENEEGEPRKMTTWTKPSLHPKGKIYLLLTGAFGIDPDKDISDEELKSGTFINRFIGQRLRLQIANVAKENEKDVLTDKITGFVPYKKAEVKRSAKFSDDEETPAPAAALRASGIPDLSDED